MKKLIIFDLDGTLAKSKSSIDEEMATLLYKLLTVVKVSIISGGDWPQFKKQVISHLAKDTNFKNLYILPTCGTKFYVYKNKWEKLYEESFTDKEKDKILRSLKTAIDQSGLTFEKLWGEQIEDRGSQITFSALGQKAPLKQKEKWDPDFAKRKKIKAALDKLIPDFSVNLGGSTSIDITKPGVDKGYGIGKLRKILDMGTRDMLFIGDALFPGGNDYPAKKAGVKSIQVKGPEETKRIVDTINACMG
ncbi:MAG TPA: HAD-IIB family hydrolase [Chitinophagaceae bacterium]|jgi:HAD superfamily hydrolase (TIGR01484 family)|nr:HAD-IIB family hydrolase [Chitinophagaceae bacterium]